MTERNPGLVADPLVVGVTRPAMRGGVTYAALVANAMLTMELFLLSKNLLTLGIAVPLHGIAMLLCARDARFFDLALLWVQTRLPAYLRTCVFWHASSYGPLTLDLPTYSGGRRAIPKVVA